MGIKLLKAYELECDLCGIKVIHHNPRHLYQTDARDALGNPVFILHGLPDGWDHQGWNDMLLCPKCNGAELENSEREPLEE